MYFSKQNNQTRLFCHSDAIYSLKLIIFFFTNSVSMTVKSMPVKYFVYNLPSISLDFGVLIPIAVASDSIDLVEN